MFNSLWKVLSLFYDCLSQFIPIFTTFHSLFLIFSFVIILKLKYFSPSSLSSLLSFTSPSRDDVFILFLDNSFPVFLYYIYESILLLAMFSYHFLMPEYINGFMCWTWYIMLSIEIDMKMIGFMFTSTFV